MQLGTGIGRSQTNEIDDFVLTRKVNLPELIFNQNPNKDCYFEIDAGNKWRLSDRCQCYSCHRYKYTMVFFKQAREGQRPADLNPEMKEVTNPELVTQIRDALNLSFKDKVDTAPYIVGTVVNDHPRGFRRKLRMLRADIFTALSICNSNHFL